MQGLPILHQAVLPGCRPLLLYQWLEEQPGLHGVVLPSYPTCLRRSPAARHRASWYLQQLLRDKRHRYHPEIIDQGHPNTNRTLAVLHADGSCDLRIRMLRQLQDRPQVLPVNWPQLLEDGVITAVRGSRSSKARGLGAPRRLVGRAHDGG